MTLCKKGLIIHQLSLMKSKLALENGALFSGESFGADADVAGRAIFYTNTISYQKVHPNLSGDFVRMMQIKRMGNTLVIQLANTR